MYVHLKCTQKLHLSSRVFPQLQITRCATVLNKPRVSTRVRGCCVRDRWIRVAARTHQSDTNLLVQHGNPRIFKRPYNRHGVTSSFAASLRVHTTQAVAMQRAAICLRLLSAQMLRPAHAPARRIAPARGMGNQRWIWLLQRSCKGVKG